MAEGADVGRLAAEHGVTRETVKAVWHGKTWRSVGGPTGAPEPVRQLPDEQVRRIRQAYADGRTQVELAQAYGVPQSYISRIVRGETKRRAGGPLPPAGEAGGG